MFAVGLLWAGLVPSAAALHDRRLIEVPTVTSEVMVSAGRKPTEVSWTLRCSGLDNPITGGAPYSSTHAVPHAPQ